MAGANGQENNSILINLTLTIYDHTTTSAGSTAIDSLVKMLQSNTPLKKLNFQRTKFFTESDVCKLFESLVKNDSLQVLSLQDVDAACGKHVFHAIMHMLEVNKTLKEINLMGPKLYSEVHLRGVVKQHLEKNAAIHKKSLS
jgi:hypothetical protein